MFKALLLTLMWALMQSGCSEPIAGVQLDRCMKLVKESTETTRNCVAGYEKANTLLGDCVGRMQRCVKWRRTTTTTVLDHCDPGCPEVKP